MDTHQERLGRTFAALADPTRRSIIEHLAHQESASIGELAQPFEITLSAIMKHLDVLSAAGLITRSKSGRTVTVKLRAEPVQEALQWLARHERFWIGSLERLAAHAEQQERSVRRR